MSTDNITASTSSSTVMTDPDNTEGQSDPKLTESSQVSFSIASLPAEWFRLLTSDLGSS